MASLTTDHVFSVLRYDNFLIANYKHMHSDFIIHTYKYKMFNIITVLL